MSCMPHFHFPYYDSIVQLHCIECRQPVYINLSDPRLVALCDLSRGNRTCLRSPDLSRDQTTLAATMTLTPTGSKGKATAHSVWRLRALDTIPTPECPFKVFPEPKDTVPARFTAGTRHLTSPQENAPWTGYYATLNGAEVAVTNAYGVWFEMRKSEDYEAHRIARLERGLMGDALPGLDIPRLRKSGEHVPSRNPSKTREAPTAESTLPQIVELPEQDVELEYVPATQEQTTDRRRRPLDAYSNNERDSEEDAPFGFFAIRSSQSARDNPRRPAGVGADHMTLGALDTSKPGYQ